MEFETGLQDAGDVEVLVLFGMTPEAVEILGEDADNPHPYDDNGGAPDGSSWYASMDEVASEVADEIEINQLGHRVNAHVIIGYEGTEEQKRELDHRFPFRWCGYSSRGVAYARDAE